MNYIARVLLSILVKVVNYKNCAAILLMCSKKLDTVKIEVYVLIWYSQIWHV